MPENLIHIQIVKADPSDWYFSQIGCNFNVIEKAFSGGGGVEPIELLYYLPGIENSTINPEDCKVISGKSDGTLQVKIVRYAGPSRIWYEHRMGEIYNVKETYDTTYQREVYTVMDYVPGVKAFYSGMNKTPKDVIGLPIEKQDCEILMDFRRPDNTPHGRYEIIMDGEEGITKNES
jgi:hypothetical protein